MLSSSLSFDCREAEPLLHLHADGEAAPEDRALLEHHLERCAPCGDRLRELRALKRVLRAAYDDVPVPDALLSRVRSDIGSASVPPSLREQRRRRSWALAVPALAAASALVVVVVGSFERGAARSGLAESAPPLLEEALSLHTLDVPVDVASPDPARVAAFLAARIGSPVRVPRLDAAGFGLAGGRVISVDNLRAAHVIYDGGLGRRLSLVTVPDPDGVMNARVLGGVAASSTSNATFSGWLSAARRGGGEDLGSGEAQSGHLRAQRGALAVHVWSEGGSVYSLAGELDEENLDDLVADVRRGGARPPARVAREFDPPLRR